MTRPLSIHLTIIQPPGYVHSLGFLDQARYFRYQFRRLGAEVTIAKNRLREDAVNFVFGAHLGFPVEWKQRHPCIIVNLEQLGAGGANLPAAYLDLLKSSVVVDYDRANIPAYAANAGSVPVIHFGYGAYLDREEVLPLEDRPIDLLFFGSMNARRQRFIERVEKAGGKVTMFDHPIYGPERDLVISRSKAVLNCHFYETNRFEQARAFHCLSLGTPMISERTATTNPSPAFEDAVIWLGDEEIESFFSRTFNQAGFFSQARSCLDAFRNGDADHDPLESYAELLDLAKQFQKIHAETQSNFHWQPRGLNLGCTKVYKPTWLNVDMLDRTEPDLVLDLGKPLDLPIVTETRFGTPLDLQAGSLELIRANDVLEHVPDLPTLMGNALALLCEHGEFQIDVPGERADRERQDPARLRKLNDHAWLDFTNGFWRAGWFTHRFELKALTWLDQQGQPCQQQEATLMRVILRKVTTTLRERNDARVMRADFGGLDEDLISLPPSE